MPQTKERHAEYCLARWRKRRDELWVIKLERGCADCGYRENPVALQFDHRPGEVKEFTIAASMTLAWERVEREIAKCDVVCANCHAVRTHERVTA